ncbi:MAG: hypothetical protein GF411_14400 [Candidatus Lokiarchaeota archaeon]|nr:hypothetical protein [Candidatus Lokiarchaeota archaeon]
MNTFVLTACNDEHSKRIDLCIKAIRKFTDDNIIVITTRSNVDIKNDKVIRYKCPHRYNDVQCSRILKTGAINIIDEHYGLDGRYCYIDNDVFAVSDDSSSIFDLYQPPITFGSDPGKTVAKFSGYAMRKGKLQDKIREKFDIDVDLDWHIWNGGLFLFDKQSHDFLNTWYNYTLAIFDDKEWSDRDQGTLIAAVWKHKLESHYTLPREYNWLHKLQGGLRPKDDHFDTKWGDRVRFVHFPITYGDDKYKSWKTLMGILEC